MFRKTAVIFLLITFLSLLIGSIAGAEEVIIDNGTKVTLTLVDKVSTGTNSEGDSINFRVIDDVKIGDLVIIKKNTRVTAYISELIPKNRIGKAGQFTINFDSTKAFNGQKVLLSGQIIKKGSDRMVPSIVLGVSVIPVSLLFLLMKGSDAQIPAGFHSYARVDGDTPITLNQPL